LAIVQISQITQRQGLNENLPQLAGGEFGWSNDTLQLYIGNGTLEQGAPFIGNTEILTEFSDILNIPTSYTYKGEAAGYTVQTGPNANTPVKLSLQSWFDQFASVLDFGAVGDGVTDDTAAINRALYQLYCREVNPQIRRSLFFPAGVYKITSPLLIPPFAMLYGEGVDSSIIQLANGTGSAYVAQTADSNQQSGVNIGNNSATPPQYVTIANMGFASLDPLASIFLIQDAVNFSFTNVSFTGPLTQSQLATLPATTYGVTFASAGSYTCNQITLEGCYFSGTVYGVSTSQTAQSVTVSNSKFSTLYRGVVLTSGATGFRIVSNSFNLIYAEGIIFGSSISLNASGHNIFYDVGDHFGGVGTPYTACIDIQGNNNVSISDLFQRSDAQAVTASPGTAYPRITLNNTQSIATTNGAQLALGTLTVKSGAVSTLNDNTVSPTSTGCQVNTTVAKSFKVNYSLTRNTSYRTGTILVSSGVGTLTWTDDYTENTATGVNLTVVQVGSNAIVEYTTTSTTYAGTFEYSVNYLN